MKAPIGLVLVFCGLTVGYLVLVGKLPMSTTVASNTTGGNTTTIPPTGNSAKNHITGLPGNQGGGMIASQPDVVSRGNLVVIKPMKGYTY